MSPDDLESILSHAVECGRNCVLWHTLSSLLRDGVLVRLAERAVALGIEGK